MSYAEDVARALSARLAARLGVQEPPDAWRAFLAQVNNETAGGDPSTRGVRNNNPLNLTDAGGAIQWQGQVASDGPFAVFYDVDRGIDASVQNLLASDYSGVRTAFVRGDPHDLAAAIQDSPWDAGHYGYALADGVSSSTGIGGLDPLNPRTVRDEDGGRLPLDNPRVVRGEDDSGGMISDPQCPLGYHWDPKTQSCASWVPGGIVPNVPQGANIPQKPTEPSGLEKAIGDAVGGAVGSALNPIGSAITGATNAAFTLAIGLVVVVVIVAIAMKGLGEVAG